jgi:hypothetical protein
LKLPTADTRQHYACFSHSHVNGHFLHCKPVPQLLQDLIKNITPKFHFGRQLNSLMAVSEASITTRNVEG